MKKQTDYEKIIQTMNELNAKKLGEVEVEFTDINYNPLTAEFWHVGNKGVIVCKYYEDKIGLYTLQGKNGAKVEKDVEFLRSLVRSA